MDKRVTSLLTMSGGQVEALSAAETEQLYVRWIDAYARPVKQKTGEWIYNGFLWHAFSWKFSPSRQGSEALSLYAQEKTTELIVLQEPDEEQLGVRVRALRAPDLSELGLDLHVFPGSLRWTMASLMNNRKSALTILGESGLASAPPNKALELTSHSVLRSHRGTVWRRT